MTTKTTRYETDDDDYSLFVNTCKIWIARFGLTDWCINFAHLDDIKSNSQAWVNRLYPSRSAAIVLNKNWGDTEPTAEEVKDCAIEEVLHILLYPLLSHENADDKELFEEHGIIFRLINFINSWEQSKEAIRK